MPAQPGGLNILPKKNWHVRTKENIAKVRRDEAKAAEEERQRIERAAVAEREARTALLRKKATERLGYEEPDEVPSSSRLPDEEPKQHVNFFADLEEQHRTFGKNKGHEADKKTDQEKWERQIGLLKYLGEGSSEHSGEVPWYERPKKSMPSGMVKPETAAVKTSYAKATKSSFADSLSRKRHGSSDSHEERSKKKKKHKKHKHSFREDVDIEKLRADRLRRERAERAKAEKLRLGLSGVPTKEDTPEPEPKIKQKYNSQFMPDICRQNR